MGATRPLPWRLRTELMTSVAWAWLSRAQGFCSYLVASSGLATLGTLCAVLVGAEDDSGVAGTGVPGVEEQAVTASKTRLPAAAKVTGFADSGPVTMRLVITYRP